LPPEHAQPVESIVNVLERELDGLTTRYAAANNSYQQQTASIVTRFEDLNRNSHASYVKKIDAADRDKDQARQLSQSNYEAEYDALSRARDDAFREEADEHAKRDAEISSECDRVLSGIVSSLTITYDSVDACIRQWRQIVK